ncbi:MAG: glycerate kinase [Rhodoblastus sp.]|nr:MAG: glycerate kinase [Rhodoblastus sp.]
MTYAVPTREDERKALLRAMFDAAVGAAQPAKELARHLPERPKGRTLVIGAGKASAAMAEAFEAAWPEPVDGLVVTRAGYSRPCSRIEIVEAAHPVPDAAGREGARRIMEMVKGLGPDDLVIALMSGGGSSLLPAPIAGLTLEDKQELNRELLKSGASIGEMNTVRRHLSAIKGGRLAALCAPARVTTLLISDVPGDDPSDIASGPTVADPTTCEDALAVIRRYGVKAPAHLLEILASGRGESVKPGDPRLERAQTRLIATPQLALEAAAQVARKAGYAAHILGDAIEGEARDVGKAMAGIAAHVAERGQPFATPCAILSGGETTVTVRGAGVGGRNVEFLLSFALATRGRPGIYGMAGDTDGVDGAVDIAGAVMTPTTLSRARALGLSPQARLDANDGHGFFQAIGDSVVTGPTHTNVNDFRAILIDARD